MIVIDELKEQIDVMLHPGKYVKGRNTKELFGYYFKVIILSLLLSLIVAYLFPNTSSPESFIITVVAILLYFLIITPIGILIETYLLNLCGRSVFKSFKGNTNDTLTPVVYASTVIMLFYWLDELPIIGKIIGYISILWAFIVLLLGLSSSQKINKISAFAAMALANIILIIIVFFIGLVLGFLG